MPLGAGVVWTAERFLGAPYRNGGGTPAGFDCSGFVQYVFARVGHDVPRTVEDQFQIGQRVAPNRIQPGDLLFFRTTSRRVSHVGIATSATEFIHAPNARSVVRVDSLTTDYWRTRFLGARRLASGSTPVHERR
ncbi:MAG: C40 family peptidase [Vicinamibacterales bacterium]